MGKRNVCAKCNAFQQDGPTQGQCRRHAPTTSGFPKIMSPETQWCCEFLGGSIPNKKEGVEYAFDGLHLKVPLAELEQLALDYPDAQLGVEFQKMDEWLVAKRKRLTKPMTFIRNWLDKTKSTRKDLGGEFVV